MLIILATFLSMTQVSVTNYDIEEVVKAYIINHLSGDSEEIEIVFRNVPTRLHFEGERFELAVNPDRGVSLRGNLSLPVDIVVDGKTTQRVIVSVRVRTFGEVLTTTRTIPRGTLYDPHDYIVQRVETTRLPDDVVTAPMQLMGKRTNRVIREGVLLRASYFEDIPVIKTGQVVTVRVQMGNVIVTTPAIARDDGGIGDIISVQIKGRHDRLRARIVDETIVEIITEHLTR